MNKRKVETLKGGKPRKIEIITNYLVSHKEGATPKMIAVDTGINVNTVKSILPKIRNIKTVTHGWYKVENRGDSPLISNGDLRDWNFHNLMLTTQLKNYKSMEEIKTFDLIKTHTIINTKGKATLRLSSDYPLNVSSITMVYAYFEQLLQEYSDDSITMNDITVSSIEFNKDYENLKFEGVNCITLDNLCTQFKLYQKSIGLRVEHKTKLDFRANNMIEMLTQSPHTIELSTRLNNTQEQLKKLTTQSIYNTQQLSALMEKMRK